MGENRIEGEITEHCFYLPLSIYLGDLFDIYFERIDIGKMSGY